MPFISFHRGLGARDRVELLKIRKALDRIGDLLESHLRAQPSSSLRYFHRDDAPNSVTAPAPAAPTGEPWIFGSRKPPEGPSLLYTDDEHYALVEEAERRGVPVEKLREILDYDEAGGEGEIDQDAEAKT